MKIEHPDQEEQDEEAKAFLRVEAVIGRALWLESIKHLVERVASVLTRHSWSLVEPSGTTEWFTSDQPVVRLNFYDEGHYDFKGGWGNPGTDLMMPLSPRLLLYTEVGRRAPERFRFDGNQTRVIQEVLARRALRYVFARKRMRKVEWFRPRRVDAEQFRREQAELRNWGEEQGQEEV